MIYEAILEKYGYDTPVFTKEILDMFPAYTEAYVFRVLKEEEGEGKIVRYTHGVYYLPTKTLIGESSICASDVMEKRYIQDGDEVFGVYSGAYLENLFGITTQVPNTREIVTNNETTRRRKVTIDGMDFILRKPYTTITKDNVNAYYVLELIHNLDTVLINEEIRREINTYIEEYKVSKELLRDLSSSFPYKTSKALIQNRII
ncbi:MAG: hypothetical protein LUB56_02855 [Coprobacillus sp.]|nr:hypothetical protein [Coprobacillus sp.]